MVDVIAGRTPEAPVGQFQFVYTPRALQHDGTIRDTITVSLQVGETLGVLAGVVLAEDDDGGYTMHVESGTLMIPAHREETNG